MCMFIYTQVTVFSIKEFILCVVFAICVVVTQKCIPSLFPYDIQRGVTVFFYTVTSYSAIRAESISYYRYFFMFNFSHY